MRRGEGRRWRKRVGARREDSKRKCRPRKWGGVRRGKRRGRVGEGGKRRREGENRKGGRHEKKKKKCMRRKRRRHKTRRNKR